MSDVAAFFGAIILVIISWLIAQKSNEREAENQKRREAERQAQEQKRREESAQRMQEQLKKNQEAAALRRQKEIETLTKVNEQISKSDIDIEELASRYQHKYLSVVRINNKLSEDEVVQRTARSIYLKLDASDEAIISKIKFEIAYKILYNVY